MVTIPGRFITGRLITGRFNTVGSSCGRFITGRFTTGRFIPECEKQLTVGAVLTGFVRRSHTTLVGLIRAFVQ